MGLGSMACIHMTALLKQPRLKRMPTLDQTMSIVATIAALCLSCVCPSCRAGLSARADSAARQRLASVLSVAVKAVSLAGLLAITFGPWYSFTLLRAVYSQRWADTEAPFVLGCYTGYLLLLAVNGGCM